LILVYTLTLTVVQLRTVSQDYALGTLELTLTTPAEKSFLNWANRGLIMVGMLALPAFLFFFAYLSSWSPQPARQIGNPPKRDAATRRNGWSGWRLMLPIVLLAALVAAWAAARPREIAPAEILAGMRWIAFMNTTSPQAHFSLALQLEDQGKLAEARVSYETALQLNPNQVAAWFNLGNVCFRQGDYAEASRCYREAIQRDARHAAARNNLGNALFKQTRYEQAVEAYQDALAIDERRASTHKNLGDTLQHLGRPCEAQMHLERSVELDAGLRADRDLQARLLAIQRECSEKPAENSPRVPGK
jgi:tetratricopeptide (TPR) repeat protein